MIFWIAGERNHSIWPLVPLRLRGLCSNGDFGWVYYAVRMRSVYDACDYTLQFTFATVTAYTLHGWISTWYVHAVEAFLWLSLAVSVAQSLSLSLSVCQSGRSDDVPMNGSTLTNKQMNAQTFESPSMWKRLRKVYNLMKSVVCACPKFVGELREWKWLSVCDHSWMHTGFWSNLCGLDPLSVFYDYLHKLQCAVIVWNARPQWTRTRNTSDIMWRLTGNNNIL